MKKFICLSFLIFGMASVPLLKGTDFDDAAKKIEEAISGRKFDLAEKQSQELLKQAADDTQKARIHALIGDSLERQRKLPDALKSYTTAVEFAAKNPALKKDYSLKLADMILKTAAKIRYPEMIRIVSEARDSASSPGEKISLTMRLAEAKLNGQYLEETVALLSELIKNKETPATERFNGQMMIGDFYASPVLYRSANLRQALKEYQTALQMQGSSPEQQFRARKSIGMIYAKCDENRPAIEAYIEAAKMPGIPSELRLEAYGMAAQCQIELREFEAARQTYKISCEVPELAAKDKAKILARIAETYAIPTRYDEPPTPENAGKAIKIYQELISLKISEAEDLAATRRIVEIYRQQKKPQEAVKAAEKLLSVKSLDNYLLLGDLELDQKNTQKAREYFEKAFALPNNAANKNIAAQKLLGVLVAEEQYAAAILVLDEIKKAYPAEHSQQKNLDAELQKIKTLQAQQK
ncbi:MAG: hypothetical protein A2X49_07040 [Lentisphaerae bacterium GWF2_52_8]|nr:MAG: hypothetical protein A2X49_07040 [Lentisphaerae bacterium GWF2_52_8]